MGGFIISAPDLWGKGPEFESDISHNDPDALHDRCVIIRAVDPNSCYADPDPAVFLNADPDPDPDPDLGPA